MRHMAFLDAFPASSCGDYFNRTDEERIACLFSIYSQLVKFSYQST